MSEIYYMEWKPVIKDEKTINSISVIINSIAQRLISYRTSDPSLIEGKAGISIFFEYLFLHSKNKSHHSKCISLINSSLQDVANKPLPYVFSEGISGILWAYSHLVNNSFIDKNKISVIGKETDKILAKSSMQSIKNGNNYDYLYGGLSTIPYFLEHVEKEECRKNISKIILELEKVADNFPEGISWFEGFHYSSYKEKCYNLGLAHGMPAIIVLLGRVLEKNIESKKVNKLLEGTISWVLDKKQKNGRNGFFPMEIPGEKPYESRVSWCYGDLGIAISLLQASMVTNNKSWNKGAIAIAKNAAKRRQPGAGANDTCFCHGTAGNAHIFSRLYNYTGIGEFKDAAIYWHMETLRFYQLNKHFKFYTLDDDDINTCWVDNKGILEGIAGIGLSFLASISDIEPKWDRCFLLS